MVLSLGVEESHQVWQLEGELVEVELELERWQRDELPLLWLLVVVSVLGHDAGNHGEQGNQDNDLEVQAGC